MPVRMMKRIIGILTLTMAAVVALFSQATNVSQISGVVTDPNGAAVQGAEVKAVQTNTGFTRSTVTGADGNYILSNLPIGPYRLEVSARGFKVYSQQGIVLQVNTNPSLPVALELGSLTQAIEVKADAAMAETQSNSISQVIDQQRVVDLPLNGRQATQLVLLSGAANIPPVNNGIVSSKNYPSSIVISVAGGQANGTYYLMDGADHNDKYGNLNLPLPFPDALQEFSVQTNTTPANYGLGAGAVVNLVTKSGSNDFHGNVFWFLRNGATNARNFFAPQRDALKRNQFGGTIGGPVRKNKLFFFAGFQGTSIRTAPQTNTVFVPTAAVLNGDFSTLESAACGRARTLLDTSTGQTFPGNFINPARFNAQALNVLKYVPVSTDPCGKLLYGIPNRTDEDQGIVRSDWIHSEKHSLFGRYFITDLRNPGVFDGKNVLLTTQAGVLPRVQSLSLGDTYSISPHVVSGFHFAWTREHLTRGPASGLPGAGDLGLNVPASPGNFPQISVAGRFSTFCGTCSLAHVNNTSLQIAEDISIIRGRHQITFGGDWIRSSVDYMVTTGQDAAYNFDTSGTGDSLADFMLGLPVSLVQGNVNLHTPRQTYFALYGQDNFRVNKRLSLNLGLRWEPYFPEYDTQNRATHFDLNGFLAGQQSKVFQNAPPGMLFPGDSGIPRAGTYGHLADFGPRAGLVWDARGNGRTVVRTSYGLLYDLPDMQFFDRFGIGPPWGSTITIFNPPGGFTNPYQGYPGGAPFPLPIPPPANVFFPPGGQFVNLPLHISPTYMQQWNFTVQHQVGQDWLLSASYLGNKSTHRWITQQGDPAIYIPGVCDGKPCSSTANTTARRMLSLLNPAGAAAISSLVIADDGANAHYNGLLLSARHRLSHNFSVLANYTWAHCISEGDFNSELAGVTYQNPANRRADRSNCQADLRQIFNASVVANMPSFQNRLVRSVFSSWQVSSIISKRSGFSFSPGSGTDASLTGVGADRPNVVGDPHVASPSIQQWFNQSAFRVNAPGTYGNAGRDSLTGPGGFYMDVALIRSFPIREKHKLDVRAEAFNVLNHPVFNNPVSSLSDANFGRILSAADPRILQFALKYSF